MKNRFLRSIATLAILTIGIAIGFAVSQSGQHTSGIAQANETAAAKAEKVTRYGSVIGVKRETLERYIELHEAVWPSILKQIRKSNIRNYSIYLGELDDGNLYLFSYFEYTGDDFEADMKKMAKDPETQRWWKETDPLQLPQKNRKKGDQWMTMREVFHSD